MSQPLRSLARRYGTVNDSERACTIESRKTASMSVLGGQKVASPCGVGSAGHSHERVSGVTGSTGGHGR